MVFGSEYPSSHRSTSLILLTRCCLIRGILSDCPLRFCALRKDGNLYPLVCEVPPTKYNWFVLEQYIIG